MSEEKVKLISMADVVMRPKIKPEVEEASCPHCGGNLVLFNKKQTAKTTERVGKPRVARNLRNLG